MKSPQLLRPEVSNPLQQESLHLEERPEEGRLGHLPLGSDEALRHPDELAAPLRGIITRKGYTKSVMFVT